ncbi:MAG: HIRAN domain-containing protein [Thiobacillus sp.]|nr:HIRAN domain-containing protein [Thiobacillus sp.]
MRLPKVVGMWLVCLATSVAQAQTSARIVLQDSPLAGFQYHAGKTVWPQLRVGDVLTLTREPDNPFDPRAVRVDWHGQKLGYVPRRENADVARLLDNGQPLAARISRLAEGRDPWSRVRFEIVLPVAKEGGQ